MIFIICFFTIFTAMECNCELCDLKNIFFATIEPSELEEFCASRIEITIAPKDIVIKQGDPIHDFVYLKEGLVKLYRETDAGNQIISIGKPFDFVSLLSVFGEEKYQYSVSAITDSVICVMKLQDIQKLILENGAFALRLIKTMNKATDRILFDYLDNSQKRLYGRVAHVLIDFSEIFKNETFDLPISRKEIAQLVGMSIENVIRTISELRKDKIINVYGKRIVILDMHRLKQIRTHN